MNLIGAKALRYFLAVARSGSIRSAAEQLSLAPSVVSRQIADLEQTLDLVLFERTARGVLLTEAGDLLVKHGRLLIEEEALLDEQFARLRGQGRGHARIVCGEGFVGDLVENGLKHFAAIAPAIRYSLTLGSTERILEAVVEGDADIGIAYNPPIDVRVRALAIRRQPVCLVVQAGDPLLERENLRLADCLPRPTALLTPGHGVRQLIGQLAAQEGLVLAPVLETPSIQALCRFAMAGLGATFLPRFAVATEEATGLVGVRELTDAPLRQASAHLLVRAHRRLPQSVEQLATCLSASMQAFRD